MKRSDLKARFDAAQAIAREGGALALSYFGNRENLNVDYKYRHSEVSEADQKTEALIRRRLEEAFPDDGFLGEETGSQGLDDERPGTWVVDPIDGTACFVTDIPGWCVSIAFLVGDSIEIGVLYDPTADEMFTTLRGQGAHLNGHPIRPSDATDFSRGLFGIGYSTRREPEPTLRVFERLLAEGGMFMRLGSAALMIAYVAAGRMLAFHEVHLNSWDGLAALAIAREVGCWSNDFLAGDGLTQGNPFAVSAPGLAEAMQRVCDLGSA
jgi:myo-inositol-1(or 4)-monophosphatase